MSFGNPSISFNIFNKSLSFNSLESEDLVVYVVCVVVYTVPVD